MPDQLEIYVVRNSDGNYFRAKGYHGTGDTWVSDINKARIYTKLSTARSIVSFFANNYTGFKTPEIVKMTVSVTEVLDESERVKKQQEKKQKQAEEAKIRRKQDALKRAQQDLEEAKARVSRLKTKG
jgi:hypothetical protein